MDIYQGKRVTVMGLGTRAGGLGVARFFAEQGALVTVTDGKSEAELAESLVELNGLAIQYALGGHQERHFTPEGADLVVRNPAVRRWSPYLALARESGVPVEMEMSIFLQASPAPVIGITGTKGKTSTSTLTAAILRAWRSNTVLAGNMGVSAVAYLAQIEPETPVVLEISNWQLEAMDERQVGPSIAVLTNIHEDHLDTYDGFDDYANTKRSIARHLSSDDTLIVNRDNTEAWRAIEGTRARIVSFGSVRPTGEGFWVEDRTIRWEMRDSSGCIELPDCYVYQGMHQRLNAAAAIAAAHIRGADESSVRKGLESYEGVKDRAELVAEIDGVLYVNDTSATAPAAAIAALDAFPGRKIHVIAGGFDKKLELASFGAALAARAESILLLDGTATPRLMETISANGGGWLGPYDSMRAVVEAGSEIAQAGDVVLLSPGCASFGLFRDEFDRGDKFREAVTSLTGAIAGNPMTNTMFPDPPARVHFIGIGGIGMSGLAAVLHEQGYVVTGSDSGSNAQTEQLTERGVAIQRGHDHTDLASHANLIVITAAVHDNPEIVAARDAGVPIIKRAVLLGLLAQQKTSIAVAGSHGKSTTSGMLVTALDALGVAPSYFVGAVVASSGSNSAWTAGEHIVVEADEYDRSFWTLHPDVAIITNIEFDHPDLFTQESYDEAFARFASQIVPGGALVVRGDDPGVARILPGLAIEPIQVITFGEDVTNDWRVSRKEDGWYATPRDGLPIPLNLMVPGKHNVMNAVAALAVLSRLGFDPVESASALETFGGVGRRFDLAGEAAGVTVVDDYAHHPTEISATLQAARDRFPDRRIWAIFQPHTFSRTKALLDQFATSLAVADEIVLLDIYAAREVDDGAVSSADLQQLIGPRARVVGGVPDVVPAVYPLLLEGDVVLTIGAGDVTHAAPALVRALERGSID